MDTLSEWVLNLGLDPKLVGIYLAVTIIGTIAVLITVSLYATQKWTYKNYLETRAVNQKLTELVELLAVARPAPVKQDAREAPEPGRKRREPTLNPDSM